MPNIIHEFSSCQRTCSLISTIQLETGEKMTKLLQKSPVLLIIVAYFQHDTPAENSIRIQRSILDFLLW